MRKSAAVILLITLLIARYGWQISYLECTLFANARSMATTCDCTQIIKGADPAGQQALPQSYTHVHTDDAWLLANRIVTGNFIDDLRPRGNVAGNTDLSEGIRGFPDRPPKCT